MSENKLSIVLKQQTPMIHFQANEEGATIRGSDLKPRLDKFLKKCGLEGEHFDYKVKIYTSKRKKKIQFVQYSDMEKIFLVTKRTKQSSDNIFYDELNLDIISFDDGILEKIKENIVEFFIINNFGKRQTKGFGGFIVESIEHKDNVKCIKYDDNTINDIVEKIKAKKLCDVYFKKLKNTFKTNDYENYYTEINDFYSGLKTSKNPYIFEFYKEKKVSEKNKYKKINKIKLAYSSSIAKIDNKTGIQSCRSFLEFRKVDSYSLILVYEIPNKLLYAKYYNRDYGRGALYLDNKYKVDYIVGDYNKKKRKGYKKYE